VAVVDCHVGFIGLNPTVEQATGLQHQAQKLSYSPNSTAAFHVEMVPKCSTMVIWGNEGQFCRVYCNWM